MAFDMIWPKIWIKTFFPRKWRGKCGGRSLFVWVLQKWNMVCSGPCDMWKIEILHKESQLFSAFQLVGLDGLKHSKRWGFKKKTMKEGSFVYLGLASSTTPPNTLRLRSCGCFSRGEGGALGTWTGVKALEDADVFGHDRCHQLFGGGQILHETGSTDQEGEKREDAIGFKQPSGQGCFFFF